MVVVGTAVVLEGSAAWAVVGVSPHFVHCRMNVAHAGAERGPSLPTCEGNTRHRRRFNRQRAVQRAHRHVYDRRQTHPSEVGSKLKIKGAILPHTPLSSLV